MKNRGISGSTLKIIAMLCMLSDHIGAVILTRMFVAGGAASAGNLSLACQIMRGLVGRLAFPIYCFLLVEGFEKTHDKWKYAGRLAVFACLSEIPFDLAFEGKIIDFNSQNTLFTLLTGLFVMIALEALLKWRGALPLQWLMKAAVILGGAALAEYTGLDYGAMGVLAIAVLYLFRKNKNEQLIAGCAVFAWEITAPLAFIPVAFYNGKRGKPLKYFFYLFYPLHLLLLYGAAIIILK